MEVMLTLAIRWDHFRQSCRFWCNNLFLDRSWIWLSSLSPNDKDNLRFIMAIYTADLKWISAISTESVTQFRAVMSAIGWPQKIWSALSPIAKNQIQAKRNTSIVFLLPFWMSEIWVQYRRGRKYVRKNNYRTYRQTSDLLTDKWLIEKSNLC